MKNRYRYAALCLAAILSSASLTGCKDTKIVLTTGLASDELFRIGSVSCSLSEALVYLNNQKNQYENVYGIEMWDHDFGTITMEEYLKNQVVSQLAQVKSMVLLADEQQIGLSEEELSLSRAAAAEYLSSLSEGEKKLLKVDPEEIQKMYEDYCLAYKAYDQITQEVSVEISDDEARIIQIQQIFVPEEGLAKELRRKLEEGGDFEALASNYSKASQTTIAIARGDKEDAFEQVAFDLDNNGISDVFAADGGYYILKCLNTYMEESEENKVKVAQKQKSERFRKVYSDLMQETLSEFQEQLWENIHFTDYEEVKTSSFFEIYQKHFKS